LLLLCGKLLGASHLGLLDHLLNLRDGDVAWVVRLLLPWSRLLLLLLLEWLLMVLGLEEVGRGAFIGGREAGLWSLRKPWGKLLLVAKWWVLTWGREGLVLLVWGRKSLPAHRIWGHLHWW